jgi:hypothetical protein
MAKVGRNDPCPCGSGKKFKKCCGAEASEAPPSPGLAQAQRVHTLDNALAERIMAWSIEHLGRECLREASAVYLGEEDARVEELEAGLMWSWLTYSYRDEERDALAWYFLDSQPKLHEAEKALLLAQLQATPSVFQVEGVVPGESIELIDRLTLVRHHVTEGSASRSLVPGHVILARVVVLPELRLIMGLHPHALPPRAGEEFVSAARKRLKARSGRAVTLDRMFDPELQLELLYQWRDAQRAQRARPAPRLANTDGHDVLITRDRYSFEASDRTRVLAGLLKLEGAEAAEDDVGVSRVDFLGRGATVPAAFGRTLLGKAELSATTFVLESDSVERSDQLRVRVEKSLGALVRFRLREHADPMSKARGTKVLDARSLVETPLVPPEFVEIARAMRQEYMKRWLDMDIPALGGETPRVASKSKRGRARLELLLREMEHDEARIPENERIDLRPLRAELGLLSR